MSDVRFKEPAIEGKEPNTGNLRLDLRDSACDDPRIKATLYDFDANGMLQSITLGLGSPGRAGAGADLHRACLDAVALPYVAAAAVTGASAG